MKVLIIGGSGFIGKNLKNYLEKKKIKVVATCYPDHIDGFLFYNSITASLKELKLDLSQFSHAIICAAISNIAECKKNEDLAYKINVSGNIKIIKECWENNIIPVFLSSDAVFDGEKGNYSEEDKKNPVNNYGKHKMIVEEFLINSNKPYLITRLSKVFGIEPNDGTFLTGWISDLKKGKTIYCAIDQIFSPIYIEDLISLFYKAINMKLTGLYNFCSPESFSRYELAIMLKEELKIQDGNIIPCKIDEIKNVDKLPKNISMNPSKIINATGHNFIKMNELINKIKEKINLF